MNIRVHVRQFSPDEGELISEASDLGLAVGQEPERVTVHDNEGREATFTLSRGGRTEIGWKLGLNDYVVPAEERNGSCWVPRNMVIFND